MDFSRADRFSRGVSDPPRELAAERPRTMPTNSSMSSSPSRLDDHATPILVAGAPSSGRITTSRRLSERAYGSGRTRSPTFAATRSTADATSSGVATSVSTGSSQVSPSRSPGTRVSNAPSSCSFSARTAIVSVYNGTRSRPSGAERGASADSRKKTTSKPSSPAVCARSVRGSPTRRAVTGTSGRRSRQRVSHLSGCTPGTYPIASPCRVGPPACPASALSPEFTLRTVSRPGARRPLPTANPWSHPASDRATVDAWTSPPVESGSHYYGTDTQHELRSTSTGGASGPSSESD